MDPITADGNQLASYDQVKLVILAVRLAFCALWITQFSEKYSDVSTYIVDNHYPFSKYEQLSHSVQNLITGYAEMYGSLLFLVFQLN
jgi:hypothetical protein